MDVHRAFEISVSLDDELLTARSRAFSRLLIAIDDLREHVADVPAPSVQCTRRQYLAVLSDSDLNDTGQRAMETAAKLDELPINDLHEIGGSCRVGLLAFVEDLRRVVGSAKQVAIFAPPADLAHMRQLQLDFAATTLSFGRTLFQVLAAPTPEEVHKASEQTLDFNAAAFEELASILAANDWDDDGPDERVSQVFELDGPWFDSSGFPDDAQIGFETSDTRAPVRHLGAVSAAYFQHLLQTPAEEVGEVSLTLIPSARQLGLLERPLAAHRVALGVRRLVDAAWARDAEVTKRVIVETGEAEQLVYEARRRIALHLRRLAAGSIDAEELATGLMLTHRRLAEAARVYASQVLRLESVARTGADDPGAAQLLLGGLESRLNAVADPALRGFLTDIAVTLRNAEAHEDYRFEPDTWEIVSLAQPEFRTDLDELDERIETLAGALEAAVAAFICFHIDSDYWVNAPTWIAAGEAPALTEAWTIAILAAFGHHATAVRLYKDANSVEIDVSPPDEGLAGDALLSVAVATAHLVHPDAVIHVRDAAADCELLAVDGGSVRRFSSADQGFKDLALWHVIVAARLSRGQTREQAARDAVATMVLVIEHNDIGGLVEAVAHRDARPFRHLRRRLGYVRKFAAGFADCLPKNSDPLRALTAAEQAVVLASRWDSRGLDRLEQALARLVKWREAHASQSPTFGRFVD